MADDLNKLKELKENVTMWHKYWKQNNDKWHSDRRFVFKSSLNQQQQQMLGELDRNPFEFNVIEQLLSKNLGEFSKQEPSFTVHSAPDSANVDLELMKYWEGHLLAILYRTKEAQFEQKVWEDIQSGGFAAFKVEPNYSGPYTFNQEINWLRCYLPTMCGWDPIANLPHKGDGDFCYEIVPVTEDKLKALAPDYDPQNLTEKSLGDITWSYQSEGRKIYLFCNMYEKERRERIYFISQMIPQC